MAVTAKNPNEDAFILAQALYSILRTDLSYTNKEISFPDLN